MNNADPGQEEELLENWIKELEEGIKGMTDVVGSFPSEEGKPTTETASVSFKQPSHRITFKVLMLMALTTELH